MTNNIEQLEKLVEARKPLPVGPWYEGEGCVNGYVSWQAHEDERGGMYPLSDYDGTEPLVMNICEPLRKFLALAGSVDLSAILTQMKEQQAKIEKLEKVVEAAKWVICDASGVNKDEDCDWLVSSDAMNDLDQALAALGEQR